MGVRVIPVESLAKDVVEKLRSLQKALGAKGALVGMLPGRTPSDLRPVFLSDGSLFLYRGLMNAGSPKAKELAALYKRVREFPFWGNDNDFADRGDLFWVRRPLFQTTLEGGPSQTFDGNEFIRRLLHMLHDFHRSGVVHGHVAPQNVAIIGNDVHLFDVGFARVEKPRDAAAIAPEIKSGGEATAASDIFGLGIILKEVLRMGGSTELSSLIEAMVSTDPLKRPTLNEVTRVIAPSFDPSPRGPVRSSSVSGNIRSGKLIDSKIKNPRVISSGSLSLKPPTSHEEEEKLWKKLHEHAVREEPVEVYREPARERPHAVPPSVPQGSHARLFDLFLAMVAAALVAMLGVFVWSKLSSPDVNKNIADVPYATYWASNQPSMMQIVARAAIAEPRSDAAITIINDAQTGVAHPLVQGTLLKIAFLPDWEGQLEDSDRSLALSLALMGIVATPASKLPPLAEAHPGILFAIIGSLPLSNTAQGLDQIDAQVLTKLPDPFGSRFNEFLKTGVTTLADPSLRGYAHLLAGDSSEDAVAHVFPDNTGAMTGPETELMRLSLLYPLIAKAPELSTTVLKVLSQRNSTVGKALKWFESDQAAGWDKVSSATRLGILVGKLSDATMRFEQYADLIAFPSERVRKEALLRLSKQLGPQFQSTLEVLGGPENYFTGSQNVGLLSALQLQGDSADAFISRWFELSPDPRTVVAIIAARSDIQGLDVFNVEAARYLKDKQWTASLETMKKLVGHPEPLVRALAYAKLDPRKNEEAALLQAMEKVEPSERLRDLIHQKLESSVKAGKKK